MEALDLGAVAGTRGELDGGDAGESGPQTGALRLPEPRGRVAFQQSDGGPGRRFLPGSRAAALSLGHPLGDGLGVDPVGADRDQASARDQPLHVPDGDTDPVRSLLRRQESHTDSVVMTTLSIKSNSGSSMSAAGSCLVPTGDAPTHRSGAVAEASVRQCT